MIGANTNACTRVRPYLFDLAVNFRYQSFNRGCGEGHLDGEMAPARSQCPSQIKGIDVLVILQKIGIYL